MKQIITGTCCLLLMICVYTSCRKNETIKEPETIAAKQKNGIITSAKEFFDSNIDAFQATAKSGSNKGVSNRQQVGKMPLWETAYVTQTKDKGDAVIVALKYEKPLYFKTSFGNDDKLSMEKQSKLWIYKDVSGKYKSEVIITLPTKGFLEGAVKSFEGYILTEDWNGNNINKEKRSTNNTKNLTKNLAKKIPVTDNNIAARRGEGMCNVIFWYLCDVDNNGNNSNCQYQFTEVLDCDEGEKQDQFNTGNETQPGGGSIQDNSCYQLALSQFEQEVSGGSPTSTTQSVEVIDAGPFTKYKNPKWSCFSGFGGWELISKESGEVKLTSTSPDTWAWVSLSHNNLVMNGSTLPGVSVMYTSTGTPSFTPTTAQSTNILYANMELDLNVTYYFVCNCPNIPILNNLVPPKSRNYSPKSPIWDAKP